MINIESNPNMILNRNQLITGKLILESLFIIFVFVPFLFPTGLQYSSSFHFLFSVLYYWRIVSSFLSLFLALLLFVKRNLSISHYLLLISVLWIGACTIIKDGSISSYLSSWGGFLCFFCGASYFMKYRKLLFLRLIRDWLALCAIINLITMIIYPNGMILDNLIIINDDSKYVWFWSFKNSLCNLFIPLLATTIYYDYLKNKNYYFSILMYVISLVTATLSHSGTLLFVIIIIGALWLISKLNRISSNIGVKFFAVFGVILTIGIVFFNMQSLFPHLVEDILHKDLTFTSRTSLWDYAIEDIKNSIWLGYGVQTSTTFGLLRYSNSYSHCHNAILTLAYQSGIIGLILYTSFFTSITYKAKGHKAGFLIGSILFGQLLFHITGSLGGCGIFLLFVIIQDLSMD